MPLMVIKIGGSVVTDKKSEAPKINFKNIDFVAQQFNGFYQESKNNFIIINGNGSCGHQICEQSGIYKETKTKEQSFAFALTQKYVSELNLAVTSSFQKFKMPAMPCQLACNIVSKNRKIHSFDLAAIKGMLEINLLPIGSGIPAYDRLHSSAIISGDQITPYIAKKLNAEKIIEVSDVEGIFTANPKIDKTARLIPEINAKNYKETEKYLSGSTAADVTGGMKQKYIELLDAAKTGTVCQIVDLKHFKDALEGKPAGTVINLQK